MWTIGAGDHVSNQTRAEAHSRLESHGLSAQNRITEEATRQQIQVVEAGQRHALFDQNQAFQAAVRVRQRRARQAVHDAVQGSTEVYQVAKSKENSGCPIL